MAKATTATKSSLGELFALSPLDGRYARQMVDTREYFSEFGLMRYRLRVEIAYLLALSKLGLLQVAPLAQGEEHSLNGIIENFDETGGLRIKELEAVTNHDVKALEYYIREQLEVLGLQRLTGWVHFGLTSQDVNNTAIPLSLKEWLDGVYLPTLRSFVEALHGQALRYADVPMLARTHGQPASPTRLGKELEVFVYRLSKLSDALAAQPHTGKFGGATGGINAHFAAFPDVDWLGFAERFCTELGLERQTFTTQIDNYDGLALILNHIQRVNVVLLDFCRDMWSYVSLGYFGLELKAGEVGSSAMPHKVNPIDFENAEGNVGLANALLAHLADKLPVSRMQRDLSDSTVLRSLGVPLGHSLLALLSAGKGLAKCKANTVMIEKDLSEHAVVLAEAYQVILRRENVADGYELLKALTRNNELPNLEQMRAFVEGLPVSESVKGELRSLTPDGYIGRTRAF